MKTRFLALLTLCALFLIPASAQPALPLPAAVNAPTDQWAVQVAPGTDANALAASLGYTNDGQIGTLDGWYLFRATDAVSSDNTRTLGLRGAPGVLQVQPQFALRRAPRGVEDLITDPLFVRQWHINNMGVNGEGIGEDANVLGAWNYSPVCCDGTGVVVASVDDGVWWKNPDLTPNYNASLSRDFLKSDGDPSGGWHGTAVAGVMAAADDGSSCGVGMAYNAEIAGLRMLGGGTTDAVEAASLGYKPDEIHVYNNSWGPWDDGMTFGAPGPLALAQMEQSITSGRGGLGTIYVWANGNGLDSFDDSNADGYTNLIYTISVAASDDTGEQSWYSEPGANILINAPSNGGSRGITTTGYNATSCTNSFGGTSSASPLVGGVVALMLDANPDLTWRDVQYILMQTADINDPTDTEWAVNAAGYMFNPKYGFGRVDAAEAVAYASIWDNVPDAGARIGSDQLTVNLAIPDATGLGRDAGLASTTYVVTEAKQLEQVEVLVDISHGRRGDLEMILESPSGTRSTLIRVRPFDDNEAVGTWHFSSNQFWGETSVGTWKLEIRDHVQTNTGTLNTWELLLNGISQDPVIVGQSENVNTLNNRAVTLEVLTVDMAGTTYQWYEVDGITETPVSLATTRTLTVQAPSGGSDIYRLKVTTGVTTAVSADFTVTGQMFTELPIYGDLAQNTERPKEALGWLRLNAAGNDKIVCEDDSCIFRFTGSATEKTQIRQYVDISNLDFEVGDSLVFSTNHQGKARGQLVVIAHYGNGEKRDCKTPLRVSATLINTGCTLELNNADVTELVAYITNKSKVAGQRLDVSDLTLRWVVGGARSENPALALPPVPDGFRNGQ